MRSSVAWLLLLAAGFTWGVWRLFDLRFSSGDIYPQYSSLRADPQGARALFESLGDLPGFTVERNFRQLDQLPKRRQTLFYIGVSPNNFEETPEDELKLFEGLAVSGSRVIVAFRSAGSIEEEGGASPPSSVQLRWGVRFTYVKLPADPDRKNTALVLSALNENWTGRGILERRYGAGSIVLMPLAYPLSNEALQQNRDTELLARLVGGNRRVVFDETHLGVTESGSVAGLARKYHLEGLMLALLLLVGLFIWKNSTSLLPPRQTARDGLVVESTQDSYAGLANLLRRNIPPAKLLGVCLEEWERTRPRHSPHKLERVRALARAAADPVSAYRQIGTILAERK